MNALRELRVRTATVVRDGVQTSVDAGALVVGDLVLLEAGARVPADGRVVDAVTLSVDEAALTGESVPVSKVTAALRDAGTVLADQLNMVHSTTTVTTGRGHMLVTAIGAATEIGHIKSLLANADSCTVANLSNGTTTSFDRTINTTTATDYNETTLFPFAPEDNNIVMTWERISGTRTLEVNSLTFAVAAKRQHGLSFPG